MATDRRPFFEPRLPTMALRCISGGSERRKVAERDARRLAKHYRQVDLVRRSGGTETIVLRLRDGKVSDGD